MTFHPLDPLSSDEFSTVAEVLGREHGVGDGWRFASIEMIEPSKSEVAAFDADGTVPARRAVSVVLNRA
jgi:primary-amine oxidase